MTAVNDRTALRVEIVVPHRDRAITGARAQRSERVCRGPPPVIPKITCGGYRRGMKRITYAGGSILTGDDVAGALLEYVTTHSLGDESVAVDIRVLELDGTTRTHTLVLGPATELDVADVPEETLEGEVELFPLPIFPPGRVLAVEEPSAEAEAEAEAHAADFNRAVDEIDEGADRGFDP
jgi:hypothetical protein